MSKTKYDYECDFEDLLDSALNDLSPNGFAGLLDSISMMIADYEDCDGEQDG